MVDSTAAVNKQSGRKAVAVRVRCFLLEGVLMVAVIGNFFSVRAVCIEIALKIRELDFYAFVFAGAVAQVDVRRASADAACAQFEPSLGFEFFFTEIEGLRMIEKISELNCCSSLLFV